MIGEEDETKPRPGTTHRHDKRKKSEGNSTVKVIFVEDFADPKHGYAITLSEQYEEDLDPSLGIYVLPKDSTYWRADSMRPLDEKELKKSGITNA